MASIGVLVVDDSVVIRRIVSSVLDDDPDITVVGTAANGRIALDKLEALRPDIVILDVEMPVMDGLATLRELRRTHPTLPVLMFSTVTERGAMATLDALAAGATDYVTKPTHAASATASVDRVRAELVPKIKGLVGAARTRAVFANRPLPKPPTPAGSAVRQDRVDIIVIGASTGGPDALSSIVAGLRSNLSVPILVVQHMPPLFTRLFAARLDRSSDLHVVEAVDGQLVEPGHIIVAPGDQHLTVRRQGTDVRVRLTNDPPENYCRPVGRRAVPFCCRVVWVRRRCVRTDGYGTGRRPGGCAGARRGRSNHRARRSEFGRMGHARRGSGGRRRHRRRPVAADRRPAARRARQPAHRASNPACITAPRRRLRRHPVTISASAFTFVSELVKRQAAIVIGPGKEYLVESRLLPLARDAGLDDVGALIARLQGSHDDVLRRQIVEAMTTNETSFFRDRDPFNALSQAIVPELCKLRRTSHRLTVWSAACSTGQEPYSIAMTLLDHPLITSDWQVDVLASDINGDVLERARRARYSQLEVNRGLPASLLVRHFERAETDWRVVAAVRKLVRFSG